MKIKTNLYTLLFGVIISIVIIIVLEIKTENEFKINLIISLIGIAIPIYAIFQNLDNKTKLEKRLESNIEERKMFLKEMKILKWNVYRFFAMMIKPEESFGNVAESASLILPRTGVWCEINGM